MSFSGPDSGAVRESVTDVAAATGKPGYRHPTCTGEETSTAWLFRGELSVYGDDLGQRSDRLQTAVRPRRTWPD